MQNMLTIIERTAGENGCHGLQSQSHREECWLEGWIAVPAELETAVWESGGYCDLEIQEGVLVNVTPRERPAAEDVPSEAERLRADVDYIAAMTGVML